MESKGECDDFIAIVTRTLPREIKAHAVRVTKKAGFPVRQRKELDSLRSNTWSCFVSVVVMSSTMSST